MQKQGDRVGAIYSGKDGVVEFFGYGVYEGDFVPENAMGWMGEALAEMGQKNPRIRLDNGKVVWGCECWWGDEERVKKELAQATEVKIIDIDELRARVAAKKNETKGQA